MYCSVLDKDLLEKMSWMNSYTLLYSSCLPEKAISPLIAIMYLSAGSNEDKAFIMRVAFKTDSSVSAFV